MLASAGDVFLECGRNERGWNFDRDGRCCVVEAVLCGTGLVVGQCAFLLVVFKLAIPGNHVLHQTVVETVVLDVLLRADHLDFSPVALCEEDADGNRHQDDSDDDLHGLFQNNSWDVWAGTLLID